MRGGARRDAIRGGPKVSFFLPCFFLATCLRLFCLPAVSFWGAEGGARARSVKQAGCLNEGKKFFRLVETMAFLVL